MNFTSAYYKNNRESLKSAAGDSLVLIAGNSLMQRSADTHFPFRQDSAILYLTGLTEPNICLLINPRTNEEFIMIDEKQGTAKIFDGTHDVATIQEKSGILHIITITEGLEYISAHNNKHVLFNDITAWNKVDFTLNSYRQKIKRRLQAHRIGISPAQHLLARMRALKQPEEIQAITKAVQITLSALAKAEQAIDTVKNERELSQIIDTYFINNSVQHAYTPIIAAGKNANTLHYIANNAPVIQHNAILFDVGAEYEHYAADISRTYINGVNARAQAVIEKVKIVQMDIINSIKPGMTWKDLSDVSLERTSIALKGLGVVHSPDDVRSYMPHAVGHHLGLDVHDSCDYTLPLTENMIITVEPGIYLPSEGIGVRIEDDVIITKDGAKILK